MVTTYGYDSYGNAYIEKIGDATLQSLVRQTRKYRRIKVSNQNIITNTYSSYTASSGVHNTGHLTQVQYGNGQTVSFDYDSLDRVIGKNIDVTRRFTYSFDENGNVALVTDNRTSSLTRYFYNLNDMLTGILDSFGYKTDFTYDRVGNLKTFKKAIDGRNYSTAYDYNKDYRPTNGQSVLEYNYTDPVLGKNIGRLASKSIKVNGAEKFTTSYTIKIAISAKIPVPMHWTGSALTETPYNTAMTLTGI